MKNTIQKSPKQFLGYGYFIAALVFLSNPCVNIVDILPDFFGYLFLIAGLNKWADLCPGMSDALYYIKRLRWVMLAKMLAVVLIPVINDPGEHDSFVLLITFAFIVLELIYVMPNIARIFDGFEYFGTRFNGRSVFKGEKNLRMVICIFFIIKSVFSLLPELCSLSTYEYDSIITTGYQFNPAVFKYPLVALNLIIWTLAGILFLIYGISYIKRVSRETDFLERVTKDYIAEVATNENLAVRRKTRSALTLVIAGVAFFPALWIDGINVIPTVIGAVFLIIAAVKMGKLVTLPKLYIALPVIFAAVSVLSYGVTFAFEAMYGIGAISRSFEAYDMFNLTRIAGIAEYAVMAAAMWAIYTGVRMIIKKYLPAESSSDKRISAINAAHQKEYYRSLNIAFAGFIPVLIANAAYTILRADIHGAFYIVPLIITVVWVFIFASKLNDIYDKIDYKYM